MQECGSSVVLSRASLKFKPTFKRSFYFTYYTAIELSGSFPDEFGEFHRLNTLDINVALFSQPSHTR